MGETHQMNWTAGRHDMFIRAYFHAWDEQRMNQDRAHASAKCIQSNWRQYRCRQRFYIMK